MNAFVPFASAPVSPRQQQHSLCPVRPAPFFASTAFGATLPSSIAAPVQAPIRMDVTVVVGDNEPVESALRRFKKDVTKSGHLFELRRRRYFETNTERRMRKAAASRRKARLSKMHRNKGAQ